MRGCVPGTLARGGMARKSGVEGYRVNGFTTKALSWSSLLSTAIDAAQKLVVRGRRGRREIASLKADEIEKTSAFAQFLFRIREKIEHSPEGQLHAVTLVAEDLRFFFDAPAVAIFLNERLVHCSLTERELTRLAQRLNGVTKYSGFAVAQYVEASFSTDDLREVAGNDNLRKCNRLVVGGGLGARGNWTIWLWGPTPNAQGDPLKLFEAPGNHVAIDFWQRIGALLDMAPASEVKSGVGISQLELPADYDGLEDFLQKCERLFLPLDSILEPMRNRITKELCASLNI